MLVKKMSQGNGCINSQYGGSKCQQTKQYDLEACKKAICAEVLLELVDNH